MAALPKKVPDTIYLKYSTICHLFEIQYNFKIMNKTTPNNTVQFFIYLKYSTI